MLSPAGNVVSGLLKIYRILKTTDKIFYHIRDSSSLDLFSWFNLGCWESLL